jgi:hypothetical protein
MLGGVSSAQGLGSASSVYLTQQLQAITGQTALGSLTAVPGGAGVAQSSATISGPGQLLSNLQQLQAQNPAKFQQVVSQIASQLQAAAQQTQGAQSTYLSNLAAQFQSVANGGSLSQLVQPQQQHHHHHHHAQQAYSQSGQTQPQGLTGLAQSSGSQSSSNASLQQLFSTISTEVSTALAGK